MGNIRKTNWAKIRDQIMKNYTLLFMLLAVLSIIIGGNFYLAKRFGTFFNAQTFNYFYIIFPLISIFMLAGMMSLINATFANSSLFFGAAAISVGFVLYLLLSTLLVDFTGLFFRIKPIHMGIAALLLASSISIYGLWNASYTRIKEIDIPIKGLIKELKAVHLTDTHLGHFRAATKLEDLVDKINAQKVDVVFFTGDFIDGLIALKTENMDPLKELDAPIFFVEGNHDKYTGVQVIKGYLKKLGVRVLENEVILWNGIQIIGLNHMLADSSSLNMHASANGPTVQNVLASLDIDKNKPSIVLHHSPDGVKYAQQAGVDLYLAGHTHGGQLFPITYIANLLFEYNKGLHDYLGTKIYVSQGTGTFGPPMRVGTISELTVINLKIKK